MANRLITWARNQTVGDPLAKALLLLLADIADADGTCFPSHATLSEDSEIPRRTVQRKLDLLVANGFLQVVAVYTESGRRTSNNYTILADAGYLRPSNRRLDADPGGSRQTGAYPPCQSDAYPPRQSLAQGYASGVARAYDPLEGTFTPLTPQECDDANGVRLADAPEVEMPQGLSRGLVSPPAELRTAIVDDPSRGEGWVKSYLDPAGFDPDTATLHPWTTIARGAIERDVPHHLKRFGVRVGECIPRGGRGNP